MRTRVVSAIVVGLTLASAGCSSGNTTATVEGTASPCDGPRAIPSNYVTTVTLQDDITGTVIAQRRVAKPYQYRFVVPAGQYRLTAPGDFTVVVYIDRGTHAHINLAAGCL
jgi:hypothetical protein